MALQRGKCKCVSIFWLWLRHCGSRSSFDVQWGCKEFRAFMSQLLPLHRFDSVVLRQIHRDAVTHVRKLTHIAGPLVLRHGVAQMA